MKAGSNNESTLKFKNSNGRMGMMKVRSSDNLLETSRKEYRKIT